MYKKLCYTHLPYQNRQNTWLNRFIMINRNLVKILSTTDPKVKLLWMFWVQQYFLPTLGWDCYSSTWQSFCRRLEGCHLAVDFLPADFSNSSLRMRWSKYRLPSQPIVPSILFLISIASLIHLLYLPCSMPITFTFLHPMMWFFSTTWSVTADLWIVDSNSFLCLLL